MLTQNLKVERECRSEEAAQIRASLPAQVTIERDTRRRSLIQAQFGLIHSGQDITRKIKSLLPIRFAKARGVRITGIENYTRFIPDKALLIYQEAKKSGLFDSFLILEPGYLERPDPGIDPWLVGMLDRKTRDAGGMVYRRITGEMVILAYWD